MPNASRIRSSLLLALSRCPSGITLARRLREPVGDEERGRRAFAVYRGRLPLHDRRVTVLPVPEFLDRLYRGEILR